MSSSFKFAIFDFDYTIINANSSNYLNKLVIEQELDEYKKNNRTPSITELNRFKYADEIENLKDEQDMTIRNRQVYKYMHSKYNINKEKMEKCLKEIIINDNMKSLFRILNEKNFELVIVSDSNTFFIETILKQNNLYEYFRDKILANKAFFDVVGCLDLVPLNQLFNSANEPFTCSSSIFCRRNICKGAIIENFIREKTGFNNNSDINVIYVGDGQIDYCPGLKLYQNQTFFVKKNSALARLIQIPTYSNKIKANIKYWKNANEIITELD